MSGGEKDARDIAPVRHELARVFDSDHFVRYYAGYRCRYEDLFASEKHFMDEFLRRGKSFLDVGCARGGLYEIIGERVGVFRYKGVDISAALIGAARKKYSGADFELYDGARLPVDDNSHDRVLCLGVTVHDRQFLGVIRECYRAAREQVLFDIRLTEDLPTLNDASKAYVMDDDARHKYSYVVCNYGDLMSFLRRLEPHPARIKLYGYWGTPNQKACLPPAYEKICMTGVLLEKGGGAAPATVESASLPFAARVYAWIAAAAAAAEAGVGLAEAWI